MVVVVPAAAETEHDPGGAVTISVAVRVPVVRGVVRRPESDHHLRGGESGVKVVKTPIQALVWEIWQRHRNRLLAIVGVLVLFAVFYPALCARMGLNLSGSIQFGSVCTRSDGS